MAPLCYRRHRFPPEIIQHAIWLYLRFTLTRLGQPDGISPSRMAEMLEVDKAGPKVRC
jgi:hypothetical protein